MSLPFLLLYLGRCPNQLLCSFFRLEYLWARSALLFHPESETVTSKLFLVNARFLVSNPVLWYYQCYLLGCWMRSTNLCFSFFLFLLMRPSWCWLVAVPWLGSQIIAVQPEALEGSSLPSCLHCISLTALPGGWIMGSVNGMTFYLPLLPCMHDPQAPLLKLMLLWKLWSRTFYSKIWRPSALCHLRASEKCRVSDPIADLLNESSDFSEPQVMTHSGS